MKRFAALAAALLLMIGCTPHSDRAEMTAEPVTERSLSVQLTLHNTTGRLITTYSSNHPLSLERLIDGEWRKVDRMAAGMQTKEAFVTAPTQPGDSRTYWLDLVAYLGHFPEPGEYRVPFSYGVQLTGREIDREAETIAVDDAWYFTVEAAPDAEPLSPLEPRENAITLSLGAPVTTESGSVILRMTNLTGQRVFVRPYPGETPNTVEQKRGDGWIPLETLPPPAPGTYSTESMTTVVAYFVPEGETRYFVIDLTDRHGAHLSPGEYRVPVRYGLLTEETPLLEDAEWIDAAWYFTVTE